MTPQTVGWGETRLVLGKHSGRHGLDARLRQLGYRLNADELKVAYRRFIEVADTKKQATDDDLIYIAESSQETPAAI
jgi:2-isopropylmalate synthase